MTRNTRPKKREWEDAYLLALRDRGSLGAAANAAGIDPKTAYDARQADPEFAKAVDALRYAMVENVEDTLYNMASSGKDTTATIFFLKTRKPEVYGDKLGAAERDKIKAEAEQAVRDQFFKEMQTLPGNLRKTLMRAIDADAATA